MRHRGTDQLDCPDQAGRHNVFDRLVDEFLRRAKQAAAGVADDHVDASEPGERTFNNLADRRCVGHVERFGMERLGKTREQICNPAVSRTVPTTQSPRPRN